MKSASYLPLLGAVLGLAGAGVALVRGWYVPLGLLLLLAGLLIWCFYCQRRDARLIRFLRRQNVPPAHPQTPEYSDTLRQEMELTILQSQINPHFLYNTLDSIRSEALMNDQTDIAKMTEHLSKFFRYCISARDNIVRLADELSNIQDYIAIQKYRFGDRIDLSIEIEDESLLDSYLPKLTLQPIVENAISHGVEALTRPGHITITARGTEQKLYITVSDNGVGMTFEELQQVNLRLKQESLALRTRKRDGGSGHSGIAMINVNARIQLCFGREYGLHFRSIPGEGTDVEIVLPKTDDFHRPEYMRQLDASY